MSFLQSLPNYYFVSKSRLDSLRKIPRLLSCVPQMSHPPHSSSFQLSHCITALMNCLGHSTCPDHSFQHKVQCSHLSQFPNQQKKMNLLPSNQLLQIYYEGRFLPSQPILFHCKLELKTMVTSRHCVLIPHIYLLCCQLYLKYPSHSRW